jgi:uncharacterized protein
VHILRIETTLAEKDLLREIHPRSEIGIVVVDFAAGRRLRINGCLIGSSSGHLDIAVDQAYGNCPSYIQRRNLEMSTGRADKALCDTADANDADHARLIAGADTFFLGTAHPTRGADASHKGGSSGFVRFDGQQLWWPDYPGNNLFNCMGNIAVNPAAALLFLEFEMGTVLQLSGTELLERTDPGVPGDDANTDRRLRFTPTHIVTGSRSLRAGGASLSWANPDLRLSARHARHRHRPRPVT